MPEGALRRHQPAQAGDFGGRGGELLKKKKNAHEGIETQLPHLHLGIRTRRTEEKTKMPGGH